MPKPATSTERRTGTFFPAIPWLIVRGLGGTCPVQGEGTIHGFPFYMRLRSTSTLWIAKPGQDPVDVGFGPGETGGWVVRLDGFAAELMAASSVANPFTCHGTTYTGWFTPQEAMELLVKGAKAWVEAPHLYRVPAPTPTELLSECGDVAPRKPWETRPFTG